MMRPTQDDDAAIRRARDLAMMQDESKWPLWPLLPIKLHENIMTAPMGCAVLIAGQGAAAFDIDLFKLAGATGARREALVKAAERRAYPTFEALADDYTVD